MTSKLARDLQYRDLILDTIKMVVKSCNTLEGSIEYGILTLIVNMGIIYKLNMMDQIPMDVRLTITKQEIKVEGDKTQTVWIVDDNESLLWLVQQKTMGFDQAKYMYPTIFYDENFHLNPTFMSMREGKTSEGGFKYVLDTTEDYKAIFILYKGLFNMLKQDTLALEIHELDTPSIQVSNMHKGDVLWLQFTLYKAKIKKPIIIYFTIRNLYQMK